MECDPLHSHTQKKQTSANLRIKNSNRALREYNRVLRLRVILIFFFRLIFLKFSIMNITHTIFLKKACNLFSTSVLFKETWILKQCHVFHLSN